jgi:hypothetical protein
MTRKCGGCQAVLTEHKQFYHVLEEGKRWDRPPTPGDYVVCCHCSQPMRLDDDMELLPVSTLDLVSLRESEPKTANTIDNLRLLIQYAM